MINKEQIIYGTCGASGSCGVSGVSGVSGTSGSVGYSNSSSAGFGGHIVPTQENKLPVLEDLEFIPIPIKIQNSGLYGSIERPKSQIIR